MKSIHAYLTFNGNCREAMKFYQECLGGDLHLQTIGETELSGKLPVKIKNYILHATLTNNSLLLMASDMVGDKGLQKGNTMALTLACTTDSELKKCYLRLSRGGEQTHPIRKTYWGAWLGSLTDKYGNHWLLHCGSI